MFLLAQATNNRELYERNYARLFGINVVVAVVLSLVHRLGRLPPAAAAAPGQVRQPPADQAGRHLRAGGRGARRAGVRGLLPVRRALDRELVRRQGRGRAGRRPEPGPRHAGLAVRRPGEQGAQRQHPAGRRARRQRRAGARAHPRPAGRHRRGALDRQRPADRRRGRLALPAQSRAAHAAAAAPGAGRPRHRPHRGPGREPRARQHARRRRPACGRSRWCSGRASTSAPSRASCRSRSRCRRRWWPTRWRCRRPIANTRSGRWRARACAACTSAR